MEARTLETYQIGDKRYVTTKDAARYLHISHDYLKGLILLGKLEAQQIESCQFVEVETLKAYAEKRNRKARSGWDKIDEWKG
jgi:hypothetical protein